MTDSAPERLIQIGMDDTLVRYALGLLPEDEMQRLDESSIADDEFAQRLAATEHELIDAYIAGELPEDYRQRFETVFAASPGARARIRFAKALAARAPVERRRPAWYPALAAAAVLVLALGGYLLLQTGRGVQPAPTSQTQSAPAANPLPAPAAPAANPAAPAMFSFVLAPPTRSAANPPPIALRGGNALVEVRMQLEGDDFAEYDATLKDAAGVRTLWRSGRVTAEGPANRRVVPIRIPGNLLTPRRHILELRGLPASGAAQIVGSYPFRIVLE